LGRGVPTEIGFDIDIEADVSFEFDDDAGTGFGGRRLYGCDCSGPVQVSICKSTCSAVLKGRWQIGQDIPGFRIGGGDGGGGDSGTTNLLSCIRSSSFGGSGSFRASANNRGLHQSCFWGRTIPHSEEILN